VVTVVTVVGSVIGFVGGCCLSSVVDISRPLNLSCCFVCLCYLC
jgi:hypothetical protein